MAVSTTSRPPLPPSPTSSSGLPMPSTSGTSDPVRPPFVLLPSQSQQQPGAAATATVLTSPVPVPAPAASSAAATATPALREWDTQSMHADAMGPSLLELPPVLEAILARRVEYLRDLVQKRIITLTYMGNVHDGRSHWFHTISVARGTRSRVQ
ncbi:hypothetical protein BGW80DRAFT_575796 [Lactifluus volemus]|nr:hypothetical protein BGW80DRAFT_575796 [Lactifluus volemus]